MEKGEARSSPEFLAPRGDVGAPDRPTSNDAPADGVNYDTVVALGAYAVDSGDSRAEGRSTVVPELGDFVVDVSADLGPVNDAPQEATEARARHYTAREGADFPPDLIERTEHHKPQGDNSVVVPDGDYAGTYTFKGTCGIASSAQALTEATGREVTEQEVLETALLPEMYDLGVVETPSSTHPPDSLESPDFWGATNAAGRDVLLNDFGVDSEIQQGLSIEGLASHVESGDQVLAALNTGDIWPADTDEQRDLRARESANPPPNHVVFVTGIERDAAGEISGVVVNDTGLLGDEGAGVVHGADRFRSAWEQRGGTVNIIRASGEHGEQRT